MNDFNPQEAASAKPIPFHDHLTPEVRDEYVQLVINEYHKTFGDTLTPEQVLEPHLPSMVMVEIHKGKVVAGAKFSPLAGSFCERCVGGDFLAKVLKGADPARVVEISKVVNVAEPVVAMRLVVRGRRWILNHAHEGFASLGPRKNMQLMTWMTRQIYRGRFNPEVYPVTPVIPMQPGLRLSFIYARPTSMPRPA
ncbi:MAG: hypothetical protein BWY59_00791 [Verrucomicrobia bacterium ADurb.Bin345]|nr:MAG: hypothetical protein BWY59_00791 [Verrucomicrobia bacterium ADurb.Bin345]